MELLWISSNRDITWKTYGTNSAGTGDTRERAHKNMASGLSSKTVFKFLTENFKLFHFNLFWLDIYNGTFIFHSCSVRILLNLKDLLWSEGN